MGALVARRRAEPTAFQVALAQFCEAWKGLYGKSYRPTGPDLGQLKLLTDRADAEELAELPESIARYIADCDRFVVEAHRHSLRWFCSNPNKYRVSAPVRTDREAQAIAAERRFMERTNGHRR